MFAESCLTTRTLHGLGVPIMLVLPHVNADDIFVHSCDIMLEALMDRSHRMNCSTVMSVDVYPHEISNVAEGPLEDACLPGYCSAECMDDVSVTGGLVIGVGGVGLGVGLVAGGLGLTLGVVADLGLDGSVSFILALVCSVVVNDETVEHS